MAGKELDRRPLPGEIERHPGLQNEIFEDARIVFRNFRGQEGQYNREGDRNFCLILDRERAERMILHGWNIKFLKPREDGDEPTPYIQVSVGYKNRPPHIAMVTSRGRTDLDESVVEAMDYVDIESADVIIRPYSWLVNGKTGVKAYLKTLYVVIQEDYIERKYNHLPEAEFQAGDELTIEQTFGDSEDGEIVDAEIVED